MRLWKKDPLILMLNSQLLYCTPCDSLVHSASGTFPYQLICGPDEQFLYLEVDESDIIWTFLARMPTTVTVIIYW